MGYKIAHERPTVLFVRAGRAALLLSALDYPYHFALGDSFFGMRRTAAESVPSTFHGRLSRVRLLSLAFTDDQYRKRRSLHESGHGWFVGDGDL